MFIKCFVSKLINSILIRDWRNRTDLNFLQISKYFLKSPNSKVRDSNCPKGQTKEMQHISKDDKRIWR